MLPLPMAGCGSLTLLIYGCMMKSLACNAAEVTFLRRTISAASNVMSVSAPWGATWPDWPQQTCEVEHEALRLFAKHRIRHGIGIEPVGLGKHHVERDHDGAEPGQFIDQIRDPGPRPWPLAELLQALVVDINDDDRPCRFVVRVEPLEGIEGPNPKLLDRGGIQRQHPANAISSAKHANRA